MVDRGRSRLEVVNARMCNDRFVAVCWRVEFFYVHSLVDLAILLIRCMTCNGNRTEWSPIRSVMIRVITKSDDRATGFRFVYHEYDYRPNWTTRSPVTN